MILTRAILLEAEKWIGCTETSNNRSVCVDEIHRLFNGKVNSDAWCAKFVWSITNVACEKLGVSNPLKQTASTATMLAEAKKTLRTDGVPGVGSIFYTTRTGGGHVGFVLDVKGNKFETIEGNTTPDGGGTEGVWKKTRDTNTKDYQFIHLEDLDSFENNLFAPLQFELEMIIADPRSYMSAVLVIGGGVGAWFLYKKHRSKK